MTDVDRAHERAARGRVADGEHARARGIRRIAAHIDDGVGSDISEPRDVAGDIAIAAHERRASAKTSASVTAIELRDAMPGRERRLDDVAHDEARPAENQHMHDGAFSRRGIESWHARIVGSGSSVYDEEVKRERGFVSRWRRGLAKSHRSPVSAFRAYLAVNWAIALYERSGGKMATAALMTIALAGLWSLGPFVKRFSA